MVAWYAHTVAGVCSDAACRVAIKTIDSIGARREAQITTQRFREVCSRESHFYQLARLAIALLVGEVASVASVLPNQAWCINGRCRGPGRYAPMVADGGRAGESSRCEDPAPTVGIAGNCHRPTYASRTSKGNGVEADNDAARRVATSFEKQENRFKPPYSRREMPPAAT